jgi:hypothetical protein
MTRKTKFMRRVEEQYQQPLEVLLPKKITEQGLTLTAKELGVGKATLGYWMLKLGVSTIRVVLSPGDSLVVTRLDREVPDEGPAH